MDPEEGPSGDELFAALEADLITHRYRGQEFKKCAEAYEREGQSERRQQCVWNLWLFELDTRGKGDRFFGGTRFSALASGTREDGGPFCYPDSGLFTPEVLAYYEQRARYTSNPIHRARYYDILWETRRNHRFAREAAVAYFDCVPVYLANDWGSELADALNRSKDLALALNDDQLKERVVAEHLRTFDALRSSGRLRWFLELLRSLLAGHKKLPVELDRLVALAEEATGHFARAGDFWLERSFLEILEDACRALRRTDVALQAKVRRAESFERQATLHFGTGDGALVALTFLRDALQLYTEIGTLPIRWRSSRFGSRKSANRPPGT